MARRRPGTGPLRRAASGPCPAPEAWERFARPAAWTTWAPHLRGVDAADARIRAGATGTVRAIGGVRARFRVDAVDEAARTWSWTVRVGPIRVRFDHGVRERGEGSIAWTTMHAPLLLAVAYAPLMAWAMRRLVGR